MSRYKIRSSSVKNHDGKENQDFKFVDRDRLIAILADGISGSGLGREAAFRAVSEARLQLATLVDILHKGRLSKEEILDAMKDSAFFLNNDSMLGTSEKVSEYRGWGTTLDCCVIYEDIAYIGHVGDSRVYHIGKNCSIIESLTKDHVTHLVGIENVDLKYRRFALLRAKLANYMGKEEIDVDTVQRKMEPCDILLMVSDGYTKSMDDDEILRVCKESDFTKELKKNLVRTALSREASTRGYAEFINVPLKKAYHALDDDRTFIAILRAE